MRKSILTILALILSVGVSWAAIAGGGSSLPSITDTGTAVGIGSTAPQGKLDVEGAVYIGGNLTVDGAFYTTGTTMSIVGNSTVNLTPALEIDGMLYVDKSGTTPLMMVSSSNTHQGEYFTINNNGYVSIGTTLGGSVTRPLEVFGLGNNLGAFKVWSGPGTATNNLTIGADTNGIMNLNTNGSMRIQGVGQNIGIGSTAAPTSQVTINKQGATNFTKSSIVGPGDLGVVGSIEVDTSMYIDTALYLTHATLARVYIRQPDGGCSSCGVDAAGTTWSCVSMAACGPGM
jgi:hypothetical protein